MRFLFGPVGSPAIQNGTEHPISPGLAAGNRVGRAAADATEGCWPGAQLVHESQLNGSGSMAYGNPKIQRIVYCILLIKGLYKALIIDKRSSISDKNCLHTSKCFSP